MRALLASLILLLAVLDGRADWSVAMIDGRRHVPVSDVAAFYHLAARTAGGRSFLLSGPGRRIEGVAGRREILINGVKYVLCFPLVSRGGATYLSAMDVTKIIEPIMRPGKIKDASDVKTVILDPGHGGHDSGATGMTGAEKHFALDVALRARAALIRAGYRVQMTRVSDVFVPLEQRAAFANKFRNAVFVSIHFNKSKYSAGTGIETYALAPRGVPSMDEENLSYSDFKQNPGNARDAENIALAAAVHSALVKNLRVIDRGIKRARFVVIKNITIPGVLIEGGFMNHAFDARLIATDSYRQRIAQSIVEAVASYRNAVNAGSRAAPPNLVVSAANAPAIPAPSMPPIESTAPAVAGAAPAPSPAAATGVAN